MTKSKTNLSLPQISGVQRKEPMALQQFEAMKSMSINTALRHYRQEDSDIERLGQVPDNACRGGNPFSSCKKLIKIILVTTSNDD